MNRLTVRVDRVAPEGQALGKAEGSDKLLFVPGALPGELVEAEVVEEKPRYLRARVLKVLEASPQRVEPPCPYHFRPGATEFCGGCDFQHAAYPEQLKLKRAIVQDCLRRLGGLDAPVLETLPSPESLRYRNKVQVPFQPAPAPKNLTAGFYVPGSHRVIEFNDCLVQPALSVGIVNDVKELARSYGWRMYDEEKDRGWLRHLYVRTNSLGEAAVVFVTRTADFPQEKEAAAELVRRRPEIVSLWQNVQERKTSVILGPRWRKVSGRDRLREKIGRLTLEFSPAAFLQVNTPAAEVLYRTAESWLFTGGFRPQLVLDVYCGVGAIGLWLHRGTPRVVGVEEVPQAIEDAYANARRLGARNVTFLQGKAAFALRRMRGGDTPRPWGAVLDPPRSGCEPEVLRFLADRKVDRVIYVSCDPATFARDAKILAGSGYKLEKVQPLDLFPQTSHVELIGKFDRM